jgi:hypothetical protein
VVARGQAAGWLVGSGCRPGAGPQCAGLGRSKTCQVALCDYTSGPFVGACPIPTTLQAPNLADLSIVGNLDHTAGPWDGLARLAGLRALRLVDQSNPSGAPSTWARTRRCSAPSGSRQASSRSK